MEACWSLVLVAVEFWSVVEGEVDGLVVGGCCWLGCCWSGVDEPELPVCANAMPAVSINAKINFLFMSLLLRYLCPFGLKARFSPTSAEVWTPMYWLETSKPSGVDWK
jgi:hypothetical protein